MMIFLKRIFLVSFSFFYFLALVLGIFEKSNIIFELEPLFKSFFIVIRLGSLTALDLILVGVFKAVYIDLQLMDFFISIGRYFKWLKSNLYIGFVALISSMNFLIYILSILKSNYKLLSFDTINNLN